MKPRFFSARLAVVTAIAAYFSLICASQAANPAVAFTWPVAGQQVISVANVAGTAAAATGSVQSVTFSMQDLATGQWWNGSGYQSAATNLATIISGTNWSAAPAVGPAFVCCGRQYRLSASATDTGTNTGTATITVQADAVPPAVVFAPLTNSQTVGDLSAIGGGVTDNSNAVAAVSFAIHELDINGGPGRWWNGSNFQSSSVVLSALVSSGNWAPAGGALPALNSGQSYALTATATDTTSNSASATIMVHAAMAVLAWDPGLTPLGTAVLANPNTNGGNYWFKINPQSTTVGAWRTALNVSAGEADVYMSQGSPPTTYSYGYGSARVGSDGFVLQTAQFNPGQDWYILVTASANARWNLVTGDVFVYPLGAVAADASSSTNAVIGAEGTLFCQTTVSADTLAWQLWLHGAGNTIYVRKSAAGGPQAYDLIQAGQMLVVPPYLAGATFNGSYFISMPGNPGTTINLDSRQQPIEDLAFSSLTNLVVAPTDFPYVTFRVQVPVQQIAWQLNLAPTSGNPSLAVRRDLVPNEFRNDAFSEVPSNVGASITLVPPPPQSGTGVPGLSDGTFFVTVYSTAPFSAAFTNSNPVITDVHYVFSVTNDTPSRAGWRYYRVGNIAEQLGSLGWELLLSQQVPGSEIALRRNAVPGQWNQRNNDNNYYSQPQGYVDYSGTGGFLQRPGHQADIWYIGIYTPTQALGSFVLTGNQLVGQASGFDGAGSSTSVTNQPAGKWSFVRIDVPSDAFGWDLRLVNVRNGNPQMAVSRDTLPTALNNAGSWNGLYSAPWSSTSWASGSQWAFASDWTGCGPVPVLSMGMGNPLQAGTYYVGVQEPVSTSSFTLQSRGIGLTNDTVRVVDLGFTSNTNNPSLAVGEVDYYRVVVPANQPNWKLSLHAVAGEVLLKVQKDFLPNSGSGIYGYGDAFGYGGQKMMKAGDEQWVLLPQGGSNSLIAGTYFVAVVAQGQGLTNQDCSGPGSGWGTGSSGYALTSKVEPVTMLPNNLGYGSDLLFTNTQAGGEMKFCQFNVPAGIASIEVRLENRAGNPIMELNSGTNLVGTWPYNLWYDPDPYGNFAGTNSFWRDGSLITVVNPSGLYSLSIYGAISNNVYPDAAYVLRVHAQPPPVVAFDGGAAAVTNQPAGTWQFFQVNVPADALGWDVRLVGVTNGNPQMVVSRDALPTGLTTTSPWTPGHGGYDPLVYAGCSPNWPSGDQWLNHDWTGCGTLPLLAMGMGNPLEPGTYYIGVQDPQYASSYTLQSRGIGASYSIAIRDLNLKDTNANASLVVGEGDYYRVSVPANQLDWKLQLHAVAGEVLLKVQKDFLPNSGSGFVGYGDVYNGYGGQMMMKPGDEHWALLPPNGSNSVTAGTYYVLVVSQGQNLTNSYCSLGGGWGPGAANYTLTSEAEPVTVLPSTLGYGSDLVLSNAQAGGEMKFYQFNVPAGLATVEVRLENQAGHPLMDLSSGTLMVGTWPYNLWYDPDPYGNYGGTNSSWRDGSLITVPNPQPGPYSLTVYGQSDNSGNFLDASYTLRVRAVPPALVAFDGGTATVTNQAAGTWQFFQVNVPAGAVGWDVRLEGVTNGNPQMVVGRNTLPTGLTTTSPWTPGHGGYDPLVYPGCSPTWPSGSQWLNHEWTGCGTLPLLVLGMGNPLEAGTYYIGVQDPNNPSSYTLQSRGIGPGYTVAIRNLNLNDSAQNPSLAVGQEDFYRVTVPPNQPDWKLQLHAASGEVLLKVQKDFLPNSGSGFVGYGDVYNGYGGQMMMKPGDEQWALLPPNGSNSVTAGIYYVLVVSQGQNLTNTYCNGAGSGWGPGAANYTLISEAEPVTVLPATLGYGNDLLFTNGQAGGEMKFYEFVVPAGLPTVEVRLENRVGNPLMDLSRGPAMVGTWPYNLWYDPDPYGNFGGTNSAWRDGNLITIPNVAAGLYSLSVYGGSDGSGNFPDASYTLRVHAPVLPDLSFGPELSSGGVTNVASGVLADNQRSFYRVTVPATVAGAQVLGWQLDLTTLNGTPSVRVRKNLLPDDQGSDGTSPFSIGTAAIVPPYLTPGTWYVEVKGTGSTTYVLTSSELTTNTLKHQLWVMPQLGQVTAVPGLTFPAIGDSGVDTNGNQLPGDQGIDLAQGQFDYYAVVVPTNNAGLLRTELQAISGNPNLYLRVGTAPTLSHDVNGHNGTIYERSMTGGTTEYGSWVPMNGRYESQLTPGIWVLAVQAGGNANVRYRLQLSCGNSATNGLVQDLALNGGSFTNQNLNGGDWRFYRVTIPSNAPTAWVVTWSRSLGSARMFVRDTVPPGDGNATMDYSDPNYNPLPSWWWDLGLQAWARDGKNQGPYPRFDAPGTYAMSTPPLRPGAVYYLGFWSATDTTFSLSSATNGTPVQVTNTIPFTSGAIAGVIPGYGSASYRVDVPVGATRLMFNTTNSANLVVAVEQGTLAQAGGPAHWLSSGANVSLNQVLNLANNWPWLPGYSYYLTVTNTSPGAENFSLTMSVPADLEPLGLLAPNSVTSARPNPSVQLIWGVTNQGPASASGDWYDVVWCSTNGVLDSQSVAMGYFLISKTVPPGGVYWYTNTTALPLSASGNYWLFVQVDANDSIYEANLGDKVSAPVSGSFALVPPDLAPIRLVAPAIVTSSTPNPVIQLAWGVTNQGPGQASGGWYDRIWFSTNGVLDGQSMDLGYFYYSQVVAPAGVYWQTNMVTLPLVAGGTYTLFLQVDTFDYLYESRKDNNVSSGVAGTVVPPPPSFQSVTTASGRITFSWSAVPGRTYQVQFKTNLGQAQWTNLMSVSATNSAATAYDDISADPQRFYRVVILP
ncbi:MAG TPA: hypothetical protein VNZ64_11585 [Candidatus Acidoferrum sp.]|nr:hypothetical protein [Candidatus Acidoferrum sp.]